MPDSIACSHILLMYEGSMRSSSDRSKDDAKTLIDDLKSQLDDGADFAELAGKHSDCPSGEKGGDLGSFGRNQIQLGTLGLGIFGARRIMQEQESRLKFYNRRFVGM